MPDAVPAKRVEEPEQVADPKRYGNDDYDIEYRLDGALHGNEAVHKPKQHAHRDECKDNVDEWQKMLLSSDKGCMGPAGFSPAGPLAAWLYRVLAYAASEIAFRNFSVESGARILAFFNASSGIPLSGVSIMAWSVSAEGAGVPIESSAPEAAQRCPVVSARAPANSLGTIFMGIPCTIREG